MQTPAKRQSGGSLAQLQVSSHSQPRWDGVIIATAQRAKEALPQAGRRIDQALALVLTGKVEIVDDRTTRIRDGKQTFDIHDDCSCAAGKLYPTEWCQHLIASWLYRHSLLFLELSSSLQRGQKSPQRH